MGRRRTYGLSWSWKRASGLSGAKARMSRQIGIPLTRSGRQRKMGRMIGCCIPLCLFVGGTVAALAYLLV